MQQLRFLGLVLLAALLACCSLGAPSGVKQPPSGTYGDLAVTVRREGETALSPLLRWLFPRAYADSSGQRLVRVVAWDPVTSVRSFREVEATPEATSFTLRVPPRLGYRVAAVEWEEASEPYRLHAGGKIVSFGVQYRVDVQPGSVVTTSINVRGCGPRVAAPCTARTCITRWLKAGKGSTAASRCPWTSR